MIYNNFNSLLLICKLANISGYHSAITRDTYRTKVSHKRDSRGIVAAMKIDDLRTRNCEESCRASFHSTEIRD